MDQALVPDTEIAEITRLALKNVLPRTKIARVKVGGDDLGPEGGVRITIVVSRGNSVNLSGEQLAGIQDFVMAELWKRGDERFPYLRYLTAKELKELTS